jgi:hypothetical protein
VLYTATSNPEGCISSGCSDSPSTVTVLTDGTGCTLTVTATNGIGVGPASATSNSVTLRAPQSIAFVLLPNRPLGDAPLVISTTGGGSGNLMTFASQTTSTCTTGGTHGSMVTLLALGICAVRASRAGSAAINTAVHVEQGFEPKEMNRRRSRHAQSEQLL